MFLRTCIGVAVIVGMVSPGLILVGQELPRDGLVMERPETEPFVKTELGYNAWSKSPASSTRPLPTLAGGVLQGTANRNFGVIHRQLAD